MKTKNFFIILTSLMVLLLAIPQNNSIAESESESQQAARDHYLIGPNDVLNIFVWKEPELTQEVIVMPDGRITFPMIGTVMAKDLTVTDLKNIITEKLENFVSAPDVTVIVKESRSRQIYTIGKLNRPGPYPLQPDMTVLQALSTAGGFAEWAETKYVTIVRRKEGKDILFRFNYDEFISGKNLEQNMRLEPNDTIVVP